MRRDDEDGVVAAKKSDDLIPGVRAKNLERKEKYKNIRELRKEFCLSELLAFYDVPKSSYLNWAKRAVDDPDAGLREKIKSIFIDNRSIYGFRRIGLALRNEGLIVNHKKIRRIMRELKLVPRMAKSEKKYSSYKGTWEKWQRIFLPGILM